MRGAFQPSHRWNRYQPRGKNLTRSSRLILSVLLIVTTLRAQSERNLVPVSPESALIGNLSPECHPGAGCLEFNLETKPIGGGNGLGGADPLRSGFPINFDAACADWPKYASSGSQQLNFITEAQQGGRGTESDSSDGGVKTSSLISEAKNRPDRNLDIYYRNRREFSLDVGWHPINIPFIYDFAVGDSYNMTPLKYTLVPIIASLRWHVTNVGWRWIFRGNMDFTFSGSVTAIPRGPETHFYSFDFGIRRNFVYRNWKVVPFFEQRGGAGIINAKEPLGVLFSQGQNLTFTYNMGVGARYNIDSKYSFSAGMNYMHISNGYLSEPQFTNYGINVYGPMFGLDVRLGKPHHSSE